MPTRIINLTPPAPVTQTPLQLTAANFSTRCANKYADIDKLFKDLSTFLYGQANPQDAFNAFGTSAGDLFTLAAAYVAMKTAYEGVAPASPVPAGAHIVINSDGTVTYTAPPPAA